MTELRGPILPGAVRQNGYVVRDLDATIASWCAMGVGPWFTMRELTPPGFRYRGAPSEPTISIAMANSGPLQLELIQQHDDAPSAYREVLDAGREGFHHLAWWPEDLAGAMARARAAGWTLQQQGTTFAYFELGDAAGSIIELSELNEASRWMNDTVAAAAATWDGVTDPVRSLR